MASAIITISDNPDGTTNFRMLMDEHMPENLADCTQAQVITAYAIKGVREYATALGLTLEDLING